MKHKTQVFWATILLTAAFTYAAAKLVDHVRSSGVERAERINAHHCNTYKEYC